ncbi:MAG: HAMP domain-containing histidine kinase, partial [Alphaproteobacteria bacterium]|nr:HAMP domain-containing histidine kinase [Alphaproteobacteria bacterium]
LMTLELDTVDVADLMATVINLVRERARKKGVDVTLDCAGDAGWVVADGKRLKQVLYNLVSTAVARTPQGGTVRVSAGRDVTDVTFSVADGDVTRAEGDGPPTGLAMIARFVEVHNGQMELAGRPGKGLTITCRLPAEADQADLRQPDLFSGYIE